MPENSVKCAVGLGHIGLFVRDVRVSQKFYESIGFETTEVFSRGNGNEIIFMQAGSCILELITPFEPERIGLPSGVVDHICFETPDIEAAVKHIESLGIKILGKIGEIPGICGGIKNVFFLGPDGERLEFLQYLNR